MAQYHIPEGAGRFEIVTSKAGTPLVWNRLWRKNKVKIPCRTMKQAEKLCEKLNKGDHNGTIWA